MLATGGQGILGRQLSQRCPADVELKTLSRNELDITRRAQAFAQIQAHQPDVVIHAAAMTAVDDCESQVDDAFRANWIGTQNIADATEEVGARLIYVSSDYVFDGRKDGEYLEYDPTGPLSVYGKSKWYGELAVQASCRRFAIARTQWVFGPGGSNFVDTMLRVAGQGKPLRVVDDQRGCPTFAGHLADGLFAMIRDDPGNGTYHLSSQGGDDLVWFCPRDFSADAGPGGSHSLCDQGVSAARATTAKWCIKKLPLGALDRRPDAVLAARSQ